MSRVVLGLGNSVDHEVRLDLAVLQHLVDEFAVGVDDLDADVAIRSERDLLCVLLAFLRRGDGGERYVEVDHVVWDFSRRFTTVATLGGTPVRAALGLAKLGLASTVHLVSTNEFTRRLLPPTCRVLSSAESDRVFPHVIVQFHTGDTVTVGGTTVRAPCPNRVILAHDPPNRLLRLSAELPAAVARADVVLLSGLNSLQDDDVVHERTRELLAMLTQPRSASRLVLYEDAGFHDRRLSAAVAAALTPVVSVHGMNEDEMQGYLGRTVDLCDPAAVASALIALQGAVLAPVVLVHTRFWAAAVGPGAAAFRTALEGGVALATARYIRGDHFTRADYDQLRRGPVRTSRRAQAAAVERLLGTQACVVPTHGLDVPAATTIGLGDTFVGGFIASYLSARGG